MLVHIKWSTDQNKGLIEIWKDRNKVTTLPLATLEPDGSAYMKQGLYHSPTAENTQTVYHDGMIVAKCPNELNFNPVTQKCQSTLPYS